jgi:hypothetical protein
MKNRAVGEYRRVEKQLTRRDFAKVTFERR